MDFRQSIDSRSVRVEGDKNFFDYMRQKDLISLAMALLMEEIGFLKNRIIGGQGKEFKHFEIIIREIHNDSSITLIFFQVK